MLKIHAANVTYETQFQLNLLVKYGRYYRGRILADQ